MTHRDLPDALEQEITYTAKVMCRKIYLHGQQMVVGVVDLPFGEDLSQEAVFFRYMDALNIPFALMRAQHECDYAQLGWQSVGRKFKCVPVGHAGAEYAIRPAQIEDGMVMRGLYALYSVAYNGPIVRESADDWDTARTSLKNAQIILKDDLVVGYIAAKRIDDELHIAEYACHPDYDVRMDAAALLAQGAQHIIYPAPLVPDLAGEIRENDSIMVRLNCPFPFQDRWVSTSEDIANLLGDCVFWPADGF